MFGIRFFYLLRVQSAESGFQTMRDGLQHVGPSQLLDHGCAHAEWAMGQLPYDENEQFFSNNLLACNYAH